MAKIYKDDKKFEEETNKLHYPLLIAYFSRNYPDVYVVEVTDRKDQFRGIDIELHSMDAGVIHVELKTDRHLTSPNIFLEDVSNSVTNTLGWTLKCESDVLSYGFFDGKCLSRQYLFEMKDLRDWYGFNRNKYRECRIPNEGYYTIGRPVPIKDLNDYLLTEKIRKKLLPPDPEMM